MTDTNKLIFTLPDGSKSYDPMAVRRKLLLASGNRLNEWIALYQEATDEMDRLRAEDNLIAAARAAFDLKPLTEPGGAADASVLEYLSALLEWLSPPSKQSSALTPTGTPCTDCPPASWTTVPSVG